MALPSELFPPGSSKNPTGFEHWSPDNALSQNLHHKDPPQKKDDLFDGRFKVPGKADLYGSGKKKYS